MKQTHVSATDTSGPGDVEPLLEVEDLKLHFRVGKGRAQRVVRAVDGVTFMLPEKETLALVGESGSGKTTLGRVLVNVYRPTSGSVHLKGIDLTSLAGKALRDRSRQIQMVFQDPFASLHPRMTVGKIIREPLDIHRIGSSEEREARVAELLTQVGLSPENCRDHPHQFSGGERQRIAIARALALRPDLIVADEPVSALDVSIQAQILNLLGGLQEEFGLAYLFISHDLSVVYEVSRRVAVMYLGKIVELAATDQLFADPLHPYTVALLSAAPVPDPAVERAKRRIVLVGDVPSPSSPPSGCRFHTRCWLRRTLKNPDICSAEEPPLRDLGSGHSVACHFAENVPREARQAVPSISEEGRGSSKRRGPNADEHRPPEG